MLISTGFEALGLSTEILNALSEMGFEAPTPIQAGALPILLASEQDFVGLARTGTGKTAAYGIPILEKIDIRLPQTQALILCPTRELCLQVTEEIRKMGRYTQGADVLAVYGGAEFDKQARALRKGCPIVVATPGRMLDQLQRGNANISKVRYLVLDEADKMLEMGFQEDVETIMQQTNSEKRVWLFSATMPPEIRKLARNYMQDPQEIAVSPENSTAENVKHQYYLSPVGSKFEVLQRLLDYTPDIYGLIFTRTKLEAQDVAEALSKHNYSADALHGDLAQAQRDRVMKMFREGTLRILVATDVAARGLDVQNLTHVIHYDLPDERETYIHRAGRTARAGKSGISAALVTPNQMRHLREIERIIGIKFEKLPVPRPDDVVRRQVSHFLEQFESLHYDEAAVAPYVDTFRQHLENLNAEEILKRLCWWEMDRFIKLYGEALDLNPSENGRMANNKNDRYARYFINVGQRDGFSKMTLLRWLSKETRLPASHINRVQVMDTYSFFESFKDEEKIVLSNMKGASVGDRRVVVETAVDNKESTPKPKRSTSPDRPIAKSLPTKKKVERNEKSGGPFRAETRGRGDKPVTVKSTKSNRSTDKRTKFIPFFEEELEY